MNLYSKGFRAWKDPEYWGDGITIIYYEKRDDKIFVEEIKELREVPKGEAVIPAYGRIPREAAQSLMDELWDCGLRPTQGSGSAGQLEATRAHLEDMRKLVFKP